MKITNILEGLVYQNKIILLQNLVSELSTDHNLNLDQLIDKYILKKNEIISKPKKKLLLIE